MNLVNKNGKIMENACFFRMRDLDREQTESLIGINGDGLGRVDT